MRRLDAGAGLVHALAVDDGEQAVLAGAARLVAHLVGPVAVVQHLALWQRTLSWNMDDKMDDKISPIILRADMAPLQRCQSCLINGVGVHPEWTPCEGRTYLVGFAAACCLMDEGNVVAAVGADVAKDVRRVQRQRRWLPTQHALRGGNTPLLHASYAVQVWLPISILSQRSTQRNRHKP